MTSAPVKKLELIDEPCVNLLPMFPRLLPKSKKPIKFKPMENSRYAKSVIIIGFCS